MGIEAAGEKGYGARSWKRGHRHRAYVYLRVDESAAGKTRSVVIFTACAQQRVDPLFQMRRAELSLGAGLSSLRHTAQGRAAARQSLSRPSVAGRKDKGNREYFYDAFRLPHIGTGGQRGDTACPFASITFSCRFTGLLLRRILRFKNSTKTENAMAK